MKQMDHKVSTLINRFYLLMAIVIGAGFSGLWWVSLLALPVFYSALMGGKFSPPARHKKLSKADLREWQHSLVMNHM